MSKNHRTSAWKILFARSNGRLLGTEVQNVKTKMLDIAAQACCVYATAWHAQSQRRIPHLRPNPNPCFLSPRWTPWRGPVLGALGAWTLHETRPHAWTPTLDNPTRPLCIKAFPVRCPALDINSTLRGPDRYNRCIHTHPPRSPPAQHS